MANKHLRQCSISLAVRKCNLKLLWARVWLVPVRMATITKTKAGDVWEEEILYPAGRNVNEYSHYENQYGFDLRLLKKLKIELWYAPSMPLLGILYIQEL